MKRQKNAEMRNVFVIARYKHGYIDMRDSNTQHAPPNCVKLFLTFTKATKKLWKDFSAPTNVFRHVNY